MKRHRLCVVLLLALLCTGCTGDVLGRLKGFDVIQIIQSAPIAEAVQKAKNVGQILAGMEALILAFVCWYRIHAGGHWLAITKEEQMKRFKEREATRRKQFKITAEDWRNRRKWDDYVVAASDMIDRTSTSYAPWTIVEANDKHLARVVVIETLAARLANAF